MSLEKENTEYRNIYDFLKDMLKSSGVKFALGYGIRGKYLKVKFVDKKKFNLGIGVTTKEDMAAILGFNIKKKVITFDVGASVSLKRIVDGSSLKPRLFAGISWNL